jgi:hypothetical protein
MDVTQPSRQALIAGLVRLSAIEDGPVNAAPGARRA